MFVHSFIRSVLMCVRSFFTAISCAMKYMSIIMSFCLTRKSDNGLREDEMESLVSMHINGECAPLPENISNMHTKDFVAIA